MPERFRHLGADSEYARRAGIAGPGLIATYALQNRSEGARDVLARAASGGEYDAESLIVLIKTLQRHPRDKRAKSFMSALAPVPLLALARVLANQSSRPLDGYDALSIFKAVIGHHGVPTLRRDDRLVFVELLAANGWVKDLEKYTRVLKVDALDPNQVDLLRANAVNPHTRGADYATAPRTEAWLEHVNRVFAREGLEAISLAPGPESPIDRILCAPATFVETGPLVTVIVPTFDPGPRIATAIESLISQSYRNLQILIMDDASPEEAGSELDLWEKRDARIQVVHLPENAGTYRARNVAVSQFATGEYITVHDDDDWSHPRKIETQVRHLEENPAELANVSLLSRATGSLLFARINNNPIFSQKNYSSMMLRRGVFDELGYWDVVNRSADAEMFDRIVSVTGRPIQAAGTVPLSFLRIREASLTSGEIHKGYIDARRVWYQRISRAWHASVAASGGTPYVGLEYPPIRPFPAPVGMVGSRQVEQVHELDVVYATDFRFPGGNSSLAVRELRVLLDRGLRVGLLQLDSPLLGPQTPLNPRLLELLESGPLAIVSLLDKVTTQLTIVRHPTVLQYVRPERSLIDTQHLVLIFNHAPHESDLSGAVYDVSDVVNNAHTVFGVVPELAPESGLIRELLRGLTDPRLVAPYNWEGILEDSGAQPRAADPARAPIVGRHGRDADLKWPSGPDIEYAYPTDGSIEVRVLGGAAAAEKKLGRPVDRWTVYPFGGRAVSDFLGELDFWVYFHSDELHESFGMATAEALEAGLVTILPSYMRPTFGDGAVYCEPHEVQDVVKQFWSRPQAYADQSRRAIDYARSRFHPDVLRARLDQYLPRGLDDADG